MYRVKEKLRAGEPVFGTMLTECLSPEMPPMLAAAGLDFFIIDTEHSPASMAEIEAMSRVARSFNIPPPGPVPENQYFLIARVLDCGAAGVVAPRIQSAAEARKVVDAVKYTPRGSRGYGLRGILHDYNIRPAGEVMARANEESIVVVQVESGEAIDDLPNTVQVPGIDATMVGPFDLSISLGVPSDFNNPIFKKAIARVAQACQGSPVAAGVHMGDLKQLAECRQLGYRFLMYSADMALMLKALKDGLKDLRGGTAGPAAGMY